MAALQLIQLLKMVIFHSYVGLPEGSRIKKKQHVMMDHQDFGNKKHQTQGLNCAAWTSTMKRKIFLPATRGDVIKKAGFHYELLGPLAMKQGVFFTNGEAWWADGQVI